MSRIEKRFARLKADKRAGLVTYVSAGDPNPSLGYEILKGLPKAGADLIELGMPFTDPMADGPAVQAAGVRALAAGQTMKKTLALVRSFRAGDDTTPIVLRSSTGRRSTPLPWARIGTRALIRHARATRLHPAHGEREATYTNGRFNVPARTAAVFVP